MASLVPHTFVPEQIRQRLEASRPYIDRFRCQLAAGEGDLQLACLFALEKTLQNAWAYLILDPQDSRITEHLKEAVAFARLLLDVPSGANGFRAFEVETGVGRGDWALIKPIPQHRSGALPSHHFDMALNVLIAWGGDADRRALAAFPEARYHNTNILTAEFFYAYLRAVQLWLAPARDRAKATARVAVESCDQPKARPRIGAFGALADGNQSEFLRHLTAALQFHKREYQKQPHLSDGAVFLPGMMLYRLAREEGWSLPDLPYLPQQLLPENTR